MASFSKLSLDRLRTCDVRLQRLFEKVVAGFDCTVICGHRTKEEQDEAVRLGRSKTSWPTSKHNSAPSRAVDVAPYPVDWNDRSRFYYFAGYVLGVASELGIRVRHGGDWNMDRKVADETFVDLPHFELMD